jgi:hypothetical protein
MSISTEVRTISTVANLFELFAYMAAGSNAELAQHMSTLKGPRTRGSTTAGGLDALDPTTAVRRAEDQAAVSNGCVAYEIQLSAQQMGLMQPTLACWSVSRCLDAGIAISRRESDHTDPDNPLGLELFLDQDDSHNGQQRRTVDFITVLIGPDDIDPSGAHIVHTWYPGGSYSRYVPALGIQDDNAVKLHNG